ncbi:MULTISPECIES: hypothetical protein [unclassified Nonomuraea]|uniref:hypothetical protein n=1 Tax=unclassified Nonomuraea TaxID=2593643 RepID=UPI0035C12A99
MSQARQDRHAVVIPGRNYGPQVGMLFYAGQAAARRGARLELIRWAAPEDHPLEEWPSWVHGQVKPVVEPLPGPLLIGKSLGSFGAAVAADRGLPAVWLTPLITRPACLDALRRATAPFLLIGGTADPSWDGAVARELTPYVLEIGGGDHGLMLPGPLHESTEALGRVTTAIESFLDDVVWRVGHA